ncbi:SMI1/KNR4 family protein [Billgrantia desiderata]|uniref:SMI1/KNR4 family protein n=1 Tax=Billgrantia desiderata TaxID=52021 RepID=UPI003F2C77DC
MKCQECSVDFPKPDIIDGTAYYVCASCGNVHEVEDYRTYTPEERIAEFECQHGLKLPAGFSDFAGLSGPWVVRLPPAESDTAKYYFGEGFYEIERIAGLDPDTFQSIFDSSSLTVEWGLPKELLLLEGDGRTWIALDYRNSTSEPTVIAIETDEYTWLPVARNFQDFVLALLPYESVYDADGNFALK